MGIPFTFKRSNPRPYQFLAPEAEEPVNPVGATPFPVEMNSQTSPLPAVPDLTPTDFYQTNHKIRPKIDPTITDERAQQEDYARNLRNYEPDKAGWKKFLPFIANAALSGGRYGGAGAAGGALAGVLQKFINPKLPNQVFKDRETAKTQGHLGDLMKQDDENVDREFKQIQLKNLKNPPADRMKPNADRTRVLTKGESEEFGLPVGTEIGQVWSGHEWIDDIINGHPRVTKLASDPKTGVKLSKTRVVGDEFPNIKPGTKIWVDESGKDILRGDGAPIVADQAPPEKVAPLVEDVEFGNKQVQGNIDDLLAEKAKVQSAIRDTASEVPDVRGDTDYGMKPNPIMEDLKKHDRDLDNQVRALRLKLKAPKIAPATKTVRPAKDGKFHYTPDQIRAKAQADGVPYESLLGILQKNQSVVIDQ